MERSPRCPRDCVYPKRFAGNDAYPIANCFPLVSFYAAVRSYWYSVSRLIEYARRIQGVGEPTRGGRTFEPPSYLPDRIPVLEENDPSEAFRAHRNTLSPTTGLVAVS